MQIKNTLGVKKVQDQSEAAKYKYDYMWLQDLI